MNNVFKKFCNSVNYNTYNNIKGLLLSSEVCVGLANYFMFQNVPILGISMNLLMATLYFSHCYLYFCDGEKYTKDVSEVRALYQEFINNYNKLNKVFGFNEPISIYAMFNYLLYKGYLSKDKCFENSSDGCKDLRVLYSADVINGRAVCRHIASMLTDILNNNEILSANVGCYMRDTDADIIEVDYQNYSREKNIEWIYKHIVNDVERKMLIDKINVLEKSGIYVEITTKFIDLPSKRKYGNHLITFSEYDGKSYYLDPMQSRIYRLSDKDYGTLYDEIDDKILIRTRLFSRFNDYENKETYNLKNKILLPNTSVSLEEEKKIVSSTKDICMKNIDIFEQFYNENKELYGEIAHKLVKIKK